MLDEIPLSCTRILHLWIRIGRADHVLSTFSNHRIAASPSFRVTSSTERLWRIPFLNSANWPNLGYRPDWFQRLDEILEAPQTMGTIFNLVGLAGLVRVAIPDDRFVGGSSVLAAFSHRAASFLSRQPNMALTLYGLCVILWG